MIDDIMNNKLLEVNVSIQILKPAPTVFKAITDPTHMTNYFISESSGKMVEGEKIIWKFPEFKEEFPITVEKIDEPRYISYRWGVGDDMLLVEMSLESPEDEKTIITVAEKSKPLGETGIKWLKDNTEGWANFLACLKAYLEYGVNLRKGAFDYRV